MYQETYKGDHISIIGCINAIGMAIPATLIFTGSSIPDMNPCGFDLTASKSGWVDTVIKKNWFENFIKYTATQSPRILLLDGHSSNFDLDIFNLAKLNNITIIQFPSNASHLVQPLDQLFFRILKDGIRKELNEARAKKIELDKTQIPKILEDPWRKATCRGTIVKSFEIPGIFPVKFKFENLGLDKKDILKNVLNPESTHTSLDPVSNAPLIFQTNVSISGTDINNNSIEQINLAKVELISLLNDELKDFIAEQIQKAVNEKKTKKKTINSTKNGNIISAPSFEKTLKQKKRKQLEKEIKNIQESLTQKRTLYNSLAEEPSNSVLLLPAPPSLPLLASSVLNLSASIDSAQTLSKRDKQKEEELMIILKKILITK